MRVVRRRHAEGAKDLDVLRRVGKMIFAADDVGNFHLDVVDHVHEMKNPGAVGSPNRHVRMRARIGQIEIDFAADKIVHDDVLPRRAEAQRALIFKNVAAVLKFLQVAFVDLSALTLKIGTEIPADVGAFIPIQSEPFEALVNRGRGFFGVALEVGVFDSQH